MANDGEVVIPSSTTSLTAPKGAAIVPPPMPLIRRGRDSRIRWSTAVQIKCGIRQVGEPGSIIARKGSVHCSPALKRTLASRRTIRTSIPSKSSGRSRSSWNARLTRIELEGRRNQVNNDLTPTCFLLSQSQNLARIFPGSNDLLVEDRHPLVGVLLRQFTRVLHKPLLVLKPPLRYRRRYRKVCGPVFRNNTHRHSPHPLLYAQWRLTAND